MDDNDKTPLHIDNFVETKSERKSYDMDQIFEIKRPSRKSCKSQDKSKSFYSDNNFEEEN